MVLVAVVLVAALALARVRGGRLADLDALPLRRRRLVLAALVAQVLGSLAADRLSGAAYGAGLAVSACCVLGFLAANRRLAGTGLVALGLLANALVVLANGAMPVSLAAASRAGVPPAELAAVALGGDPRHELSGPGTRLPLLGDVVPVALPVRPEVVSPGDALVAAGLGQLVVLALVPARRRRAVVGR